MTSRPSGCTVTATSATQSPAAQLAHYDNHRRTHAMTTDTEYRDLLQVIIETTGSALPEGFDSWGIKSVRPDLTTTHGFSWALPGGLNLSNDALNRKNTGACPNEPGDGLCVATTWRGMASGGIPARTLLLVAYRAADIIGRDDPRGKLRIGGVVASVALIDGERFLREHGKRMNLRRANLRGMILQCADLSEADLQGADLQGADLWGADLRGANLQGAGLQCVNLCGADLSDADLSDADLSDADLWDADLSDADLQRALLRGADLQGADLQDANLRGANLRDAKLLDAFWPESITPPDGWTLTNNGLLTWGRHDD